MQPSRVLPPQPTHIYITQYLPIQAYPQSWMEISMSEHALTFTMELDNQDVIVMIENPTDIADIVTEGMHIGVTLYNQFHMGNASPISHS